MCKMVDSGRSLRSQTGVMQGPGAFLFLNDLKELAIWLRMKDIGLESGAF